MTCLESLSALKAQLQKSLAALNDSQIEQPLQKLSLISQIQILEVALLQCARCDENKEST
jgi:hypothetical protein